jgi:hypothetical protein
MKLASSPARLQRARGQSMVEYLAGLALMVAVVAVPIEGHPSVIAYFLNMVRVAYQRFFTAIGLPL